MNIIWKRPDGGVSITHLTAEAESAQAEADKLKARGDIPADWELVCIDAELPTDRSFREAWSWTTPEPVVDICIDKAKEVTRNRLRAEREPLFAQLDVEYMRSVEQANQSERVRVINEKNRLRDITLLVDPCSSLDELATLSAT